MSRVNVDTVGSLLSDMDMRNLLAANVTVAMLAYALDGDDDWPVEARVHLLAELVHQEVEARAVGRTAQQET